MSNTTCAWFNIIIYYVDSSWCKASEIHLHSTMTLTVRFFLNFLIMIIKILNPQTSCQGCGHSLSLSLTHSVSLSLTLSLFFFLPPSLSLSHTRTHTTMHTDTNIFVSLIVFEEHSLCFDGTFTHMVLPTAGPFSPESKIWLLVDIMQCS